MGFKRCRLGKKQQLRLVECFVLEVTARVAADMLGMQANTTMLFYRKIGHLIAGKLAETCAERGEFEVDESRRHAAMRLLSGTVALNVLTSKMTREIYHPNMRWCRG
jgi:transposase